MEKKPPFSKRQGYLGSSKEITIREDAPENLRYFILHTARSLGLTPAPLRELVCRILHIRPDPNNWSDYPNVWGEVEDLVYGCKWYRVYDLIEALYGKFSRHMPDKAKPFEESINDFFNEEGIGWQLVNGEVVTRGSEAFESSIHIAIEALHAVDRTTAESELHMALQDISRRPDPDLTGAIQHAMASLECLARDVCGDPKATLGEILRHYPELVPKPLDIAVEKAWGYASEMGRHIREGRMPAREEVELLVGLAASVSTYLSKKSSS
jgi:hypothetical protein